MEPRKRNKIKSKLPLYKASADAKALMDRPKGQNEIIKYVLLSFVFVVLVGTVFLGVQWFSDSVGNMILHNNFLPASLENSATAATAQTENPPVISQNLLPMRNWQINDLHLQALSGVSVEFGHDATKFLFKKNEEKKLPIASLTKIMTALVILENYDLSKKVVISANAMAQEGEQGELKLGQVFSARNLLYTTLMESNNRAAYALSEMMGTNEFIGLMNKDARDLGLINTHFQDVTGLDARSYSTAKDLVKLSQYVFENYPLFREIISQKEYDLYLADGTFHHKIANTNTLLGENNIIGGKTGFTDSAKGCFMVMQSSPTKGNYLVNVVLGSEDRSAEMQNIINWVNTAYTWK